jgi:hypothetical protein
MVILSTASGVQRDTIDALSDQGLGTVQIVRGTSMLIESIGSQAKVRFFLSYGRMDAQELAAHNPRNLDAIAHYITRRLASPVLAEQLAASGPSANSALCCMS